MSEQHNPAAMLEAALNGELSLDGEVKQKAAQVSPEDDQGDGEGKTTESQTPAKTEASPDAEIEGAPIASKSGAYTIPFEKLQQARDKATTLATENETLKQQIADLTAKQQANLAAAEEQANARAEAGKAQTKADQDLQAAQTALSEGVDISVFGAFTEEDIAKGIKTLQDQARNELRAEFRSELEKELAPLKQERAKSAVDQHYGAIYAKHADADELMESGEFQAWRQALPSFVRASVDNALAKGTTDDVIEVFDTFKKEAGKGQPEPQRPAEVERRQVASLSEIAGAPPIDAAQRILQSADNPSALLDSMMSMTPEQQDSVMNRV